jgi:hypothetical protein
MEVEGAEKWQHIKQDLELPMDEAPRFWLSNEAGVAGVALQLYGGKMHRYALRDYKHRRAFNREFLKWMWAPNLEVKAAINDMKSKVPKGNLLVGMHVRVMHTNVAGYYMAFWHCYQNLWKHLGVDKDTKMSVFIATDSQEVKDHLRELAGDSFLTHDIPIVHSGTDEALQSGSGIVGAVDDLFSLAACDALILASESTWTGRCERDTRNFTANLTGFCCMQAQEFRKSRPQEYRCTVWRKGRLPRVLWALGYYGGEENQPPRPASLVGPLTLFMQIGVGGFLKRKKKSREISRHFPI